jgi:hypothetical protein
VVVFVAIGIVLVLIGAAVGLVASSDDPEDARVDILGEESDRSDGEEDPDGTTTGDRGDDPDLDQELADAVEELSEFVEEERGRPFKEPVVVELASEGEFQDRLLEDFEEDEQDLRDLGRILVALELADPGVDLVEALRDLLEVRVVGFYDPETDELVIRSSGVSPYTKITIVHELVHAHDDQWFDLDRQELDDADDETGFGFGALVEGNARRIENRYRATLSDDEEDEAFEEEMSFGFGADLSDIPVVLIEMLVAPYELGEPLTELLADAGGEDRVDEAFDDPPRTSSVVMHPERYLNGWEEESVDPPPVPNGNDAFDEGVFGELVLGMLLRDVVGTRDALDAADAWAGDWYVSWDEAGQTCLRVDFATFGPRSERDELVDALEEWADEHADASLAEIDDLLRLTACG